MNHTSIITLDTGHSLNTTRKRTPDGMHEWSFNDKVVDYLKENDVQIFHTDNNESTRDRYKKYKNAGVALFLSIHHNSLKSICSSVTGTKVNIDVNPIAKDVKLVHLIYEKMIKHIGLKDHGVKQVDFYVINQDKIPVILCKGGLMNGTNDDQLFNAFCFFKLI